MKKILILLLILPLVIGAEAITGNFLAITSSTVNSNLTINDIVKRGLVKNEDQYTINLDKLPKYNDIPFLSLEKSDKVITIKKDSFTVDNNNIVIPTGFFLYTPYTNYKLSKPIKVYQQGEELILSDDQFKLKVDEVNVKDGIVYLHENKLPVRVMPYLVTYRLRELTFDKINKIEISSKPDALEYRASTIRDSKLFYLFNKKVEVTVVIDAVTGKVKIQKPWWAMFTSGEEKFLKDFNITEYYGY